MPWPSAETSPNPPTAKRLIDVLISAGALVLLAPLLALLAGLIRWRMGSPVLFRQLRGGLQGQPFWFYKLRTMTDEKDHSGTLLADPLRTTALGRWLRMTSLDELPQLWNVLKGDMSLVGPRPLLADYLPFYSEQQKVRHLVRPGITGWAQVMGRNQLTWEEKFELDRWYVDNRTLGLDIRILWMTLAAIVRPKGVNFSPLETMPRFAGRPSIDIAAGQASQDHPRSEKPNENSGDPGWRFEPGKMHSRSIGIDGAV